MKRSAPPRRRTRVKPRRSSPRRSARVRDRDYLLRVRALPCCARELGGCEGPIEADHAGRRPMGRKCSDDEAIPICQLHHRQRTDFSGPFKAWDGASMREWLDECIRWTRAALGADFRELIGEEVPS